MSASLLGGEIEHSVNKFRHLLLNGRRFHACTERLVQP